MPIPLLLVGLGAAALGVGGHIDAKETNEKAERVANEAKSMYNGAKRSLEKAQGETEKALLDLGYQKKDILDHSMSQFLNSYEQIKHVEVKQSVGLNEISKFSIDQQAAIEIRKMTDIYASTVKSGATGAAAGAIVALAASGSLSVVTGGLATAGTVLMTGQIGAAVGIAGSALSFGAAMTPLAAVAAPVVLFTGISASLKADENLEKARTMYAEAEEAVEKMKVSETLCNAIVKRTEMFDELLRELNGMFSECSNILTKVVNSKRGRLSKKALTTQDFTGEELKLIAVTRALAGAVKAAIDTPILSKEGEVSFESAQVYDDTCKGLPDFRQNVREIRNTDYGLSRREKQATVQTRTQETPTSTDNKITAKEWIMLAIVVTIGIFLVTQWWFWVALVGYLIYRGIKKKK